MRTKLIAGNWKMNTSRNDALALATEVCEATLPPGVEVVIFPPFIWLEAIARATRGSSVALGAQDCSDQTSGAFTGQISAGMLSELCRWVIVGHSERRRDACESDQLVGRKARAAIESGLKPIVCVGESLEVRENNEQERIVGAQIEAVLTELRGLDVTECVIAYEPIWAIGTGRSASADDAQRMASFIRASIANQFGGNLRILYGGSVVAQNASSFLSEPDVDGLLVGGASLKPEEFLSIIESC
ncbi:MAG: triose-phosphate isomerase [Thermomicrobiales bacterium]